MFERNMLQPHIVEEQLVERGLDGIRIEFNDHLQEWYLYFDNMSNYENFMRAVITTSVSANLEESNTQIYLKRPSEPLEFGVITHIHCFEDWNDWEHMFHSFLTEIRV